MGTEAAAEDLPTSTDAAADPTTDDALGEKEEGAQDVIPAESEDALIIDATAAANRSEDLLE